MATGNNTERTPVISLAEALKMAREDKGISCRDMAEWLGISREYYYRLESGKARNPRMSSIWKFLQDFTKFEAKVNCPNDSSHFHLRPSR